MTAETLDGRSGPTPRGEGDNAISRRARPFGDAERVPRQIISLPPGGGALRGMGGKFGPDLGGFGLADPGVQLLDADSGARADLLVTTPAFVAVVPLEISTPSLQHLYPGYTEVSIAGD
jgi:hypothetical protein